MTAKAKGESPTQIQKFRALARQLEADEDPEAFKAKLVKVAKASKPKAEPKQT